MKFKSLLIISVVLLAIFTIGAVSANENVTEQPVTNDNDVSEDIPHHIMGDDFPQEIETTFNFGKDEVLKDNPVHFSTTVNAGKMSVSIDGVEKEAVYEGEDEIDRAYSVSTSGLALGKHTFNIKITDDPSFIDINRNYTFFIREVIVNLPHPVVLQDGSSIDNEMYVAVNSADEGNLVVAIYDKTYTHDKVSKFSEIYSLKDLSPLNNPNIIKVTFTTSKGVVYDRTFQVNATYFKLWNDEVRYNQENYRLNVPQDFSQDKIKAKIDGVEREIVKLTEYGIIRYYVNLFDLSLGNHTLVVSYEGDDKYAPVSSSAMIKVYPDITVSDSYITIDKKIQIRSHIPNNLNCNLTVYVDGKLYKSMKHTNGNAEIQLTDLKVGRHKVLVEITGDYQCSYTKTVTVYVEITGRGIVNVGESELFTVKYPNATGNLIVDFGSEKITVPFVNGTANVMTPKTLKVGKYDVHFIYNAGNNSFDVTESLWVQAVFNVPDTVINGDGAVTMTLPYDDPNVQLIVEISNSKDKYVLSSKLKNNLAYVSLAKLNAGTYTVLPKFFNGTFWDYHGSTTVVVKNTKLTANDLTKYYGSSTGFKVKVVDYKGKIVKNKYVKFYINGKYVKKVKTNKYGYATLKIGKAPGKYDISAKYGKVEITRKLTVKHALTLKTATVKKSAKSLILKATLKVGKKALKYKKVTFKFNGKTYKAKTNKYGVAKVTIKKTVLKKLKVGKTVKYQANYLKDTVKKSATVKK